MAQKVISQFTTANVPETPMNEYEKNKGTFWAIVTIYLLVALVAIAGNGLVLYASFTRRNLGSLRHFDIVIKSLAVNDLLLGLIGIPFRIYQAYYIGMYIGAIS